MIRLAFAIGFLSVFGIVGYAIVLLLTRPARTRRFGSGGFFSDKDKQNKNK
jgi:hypothetical protein